ncbi:hypothetical protein CONLIGDRAFT_143377 [Coniochaeta ligniaria NRRL 30616]|uniref:Uncharacterized protein n=1 Tax=Coniochaeta ligniaria NRRL 30616 TaxID=1408157 RepID=A0A1J7I692_9PEZI|nr:hypothetical protein CONLIGDRAFT_143377 [Coniochaeta ligniaria NRRL 30616]
MNMASNHLKPSQEEQDCYYLGLPSKPKLVARSSSDTEPWQLKMDDEHPVLKGIYPVGDHPILGKLEDKEFLRQMAAALRPAESTDPLEWNTMDLVRIGDSDKRSENRVIIWLAVAPDSTTFETAYNAIARAKKVLVEAGGDLSDVDIEIREAVCENAASTPVQPVDFGFIHRYPTLTSTIGQSVAWERTPGREGSLTCFVDLIKEKGGPRIKAALMSRHVAFRNDAPGYQYAARAGEPKQYVIMPGGATLDKITKEADRDVKFWNHNLNHPVEQQQAKAVATSIHNLSLAATRRLGHMLLAPPRTEGSTVCFPMVDYLPDYLVVELEPTRFGDEYNGLTNVVYIGPVSPAHLHAINAGLIDLADCFHPPQDGFLRLNGVMSLAEIKSPTARTDDTNQLRVGKLGNKTNLT